MYLFLIKSIGSQQRVEILRCEDIIILYPLTVVSFPWKMMWQSKVSPRVGFFFFFFIFFNVLLLQIRLLQISFKKSKLLLSIGVMFAKGVGSWRIIFFFIALQLMSCDLRCFACLEFIVLCRIKLSSCFIFAVG